MTEEWPASEMCVFCGAVTPCDWSFDFQIGELVTYYPANRPHNAGCPLSAPWPTECPF